VTKLHIVHMYPNEMNTYGDRGNLLTLKMRAEWHGLEPVVHYYHPGGTFPGHVDLVIGGGGQDSAQADIQADVLRIGDLLYGYVDKGTPMLMVCGMFQLFGKQFVTADGDTIHGLGIFDAETSGEPKRLVGNVAVETAEFGVLYGFENHSGKTHLGEKQPPLGTVIRGSGNNGQDKTEGARTNNVIGTYLHGSLLPNNPVLADWLIGTALRITKREFVPKPIDDTFAIQVRRNAAHRSY